MGRGDLYDFDGWSRGELDVWSVRKGGYAKLLRSGMGRTGTCNVFHFLFFAIARLTYHRVIHLIDAKANQAAGPCIIAHSCCNLTFSNSVQFYQSCTLNKQVSDGGVYATNRHHEWKRIFRVGKLRIVARVAVDISVLGKRHMDAGVLCPSTSYPR